MSTRMPPEVTDPSFRISLASNPVSASTEAGTGAAADVPDDEPTARSMLANFNAEPAAPRQQTGTTPTGVEIAKQDVKDRDARVNPSIERRKMDGANWERKRLERKMNIQSETARKMRNMFAVRDTELDRHKRKKLDLQSAVEMKKKALARGDAIVAQDGRRALKRSEQGADAARSSALAAGRRAEDASHVTPAPTTGDHGAGPVAGNTDAAPVPTPGVDGTHN